MIRTLLRLPPGESSRTENPNKLARRLIDRDYLSYSSISTYQRCPLRFYFAYVAQREPEFKPSSLAFGGAVHAAIELHFRRLFEAADPPGHDELVDTYERVWQFEAAGSIRFNNGESEASLKDLAARMLTAFQGSNVSLADGELLGVEEELRARIVESCPDILGRIDLITVTPAALRITDFKTSRSAWGESKIQESAPQQLLYSELVKPLAEACGKPMEIEWIVLTRGKQPAVHRHMLTPDPREIARIKAVVQRVWQAIVAGSFFPSPSAMNCATCPFQNACKRWEG